MINSRESAEDSPVYVIKTQTIGMIMVNHTRCVQAKFLTEMQGCCLHPLLEQFTERGSHQGDNPP